MESCGENDVYSHPQPSPSQVKGELQTLLQRLGLPLPVYKTPPFKGPPHHPIFNTTLEIATPTQEVLWVGQGHGNSKKAAEIHAAEQGLRYMQMLIDNPSSAKVIQEQIEIPYHNYLQVMKRRSPPKEVIDPDTDDDVRTLLSRYTVEYFPDEGEEDGVYLSMALASEIAIASHGQGGSPSAAKREAQLHLLENINHLS